LIVSAIQSVIGDNAAVEPDSARWQNDCMPSCAQGHIHYYPVLAMLWGSATVQGHPGEWSYTKATLSYPKGRPAIYVTACDGRVVATYPVSQPRLLGS
jgi:hypothetical protein